MVNKANLPPAQYLLSGGFFLHREILHWEAREGSAQCLGWLRKGDFGSVAKFQNNRQAELA